jgi:hypothetical protein
MGAGRNLRRQAREVPVETFAQRAALGVGRTGFREDDEVARRQSGLQSERLARKSLQTVTVHGVFRDAARDRETEPRNVAAARPCEHREITIARAERIAEYPAEILRSVKTLAG